MATARIGPAAGAALALGVTAFVLFAAALALESTARASSAGVGCTGVYGWPVPPFDRAHPIRGGFGDPRTVFRGPRAERTLLQGDGSFSFHQGLDVSAPDGSPVYAVASGTVTRARGGRVTVDCMNGRSFQYWHIEPSARVGQRAVAGKTLLGFVQSKREHVHLTHLEEGRAVNPLASGRLTPYEDSTMPEILSVELVRASSPGGARGRIALVVEAIDTPALPVPGRWHGFPVTPALVAWRIERGNGSVVVPQRVARDVRWTLPRNDRFWDTFARGTHQNWPVFAGRKQRGLAGRYLFELAPTPLDSRMLVEGDYVFVVTAADSAGNRDIRRLMLRIDNDGR